MRALVVALLCACSSSHSDDTPCATSAGDREICIHGGTFTMGHDPVRYSPPPCMTEPCGPGNPPPTDFSPRHSVALSPFFLDAYPATNAEYLECMTAGACPAEVQGAAGSYFDEYHVADPQLAPYPMATATFAGAHAYCAWRDKRLPTEAEWERAARGTDERDYPWGNDYRAVDKGAPLSGFTQAWFAPVGAIAFDVTPEGVHDLASGPQQLVVDLYDYYFYATSPLTNPVSRSGSLWVGRGDVFANGFEYTDYPKSPRPVWVRSAESVGAIRCARSDPGSPHPEPETDSDAQLLATDIDDPKAIAVDDSRVYFAEYIQGTVQSLPKVGGPAMLHASGLIRVRALVVDSEFIYAAVAGTYTGSNQYDGNGRIVRVAKSDGTLVELATMQDYPDALALDDSNVYWMSRGSATPVNPGVFRISKDGTGLTMLVPGEPNMTSMAMANGSIYWTTRGTVAPWQDGTLKRVPIAGGTIETLTANLEDPFGLVSDNGTLYFVTQRLNQSSYKGEIVEFGAGVLSPAVTSPQGFVHDRGAAYWLHGTQLMYVPDGGTAADIKMPPCGTLGEQIVSDGEAAYWTCTDNRVGTYGGDIRRMPLR